MLLERAQVPSRPYTCPKLLNDHGMQILEWRESGVELNQPVIHCRITECFDEEIRIESVLPDRPLDRTLHRLGRFASLNSMPKAFFVPRINSSRKMTMSNAVSIVSVAVGAPRSF